MQSGSWLVLVDFQESSLLFISLWYLMEKANGTVIVQYSPHLCLCHQSHPSWNHAPLWYIHNYEFHNIHNHEFYYIIQFLVNTNKNTSIDYLHKRKRSLVSLAFKDFHDQIPT